MPTPLFSRRGFLHSTVHAGAALWLAEQALADPYGPARPGRFTTPPVPVRVRGRVTVAGRPAAGVAVSDGRAVVATDREGRFTLLSGSDRSWVTATLPRRARIPASPAGTALLHRPLQPDAKGEMSLLFALEAAEGDDASHAFLLLADTQTQNAFEMERLHRETVPQVRAVAPGLGDGQRFGVACGDIMYDDLALYPDYERAVQAMGLPFFQVVGNHDLDKASRTTEGATATFQRHFGPPHYSFDVGLVHYVVLNDVLWFGASYVGYLTAEQLEWLAANLALVERGRPVIVCLHIPLASSRPRRTGQRNDYADLVNNREALYRLLEPYRAHVLSGHTHEHEHLFEGGVHEHVLGTTCGAWWSGDICWDGTPNGFGVFEVRGEELRWRYQATGLPAEHQMRLYRRGADPTAPDEVVVNLWDWTPQWTVTWLEDGEPRGVPARRNGLDPRAVAEQTGPDKPPRRGWVEPSPTGHMFYLRPSAAARQVAIEARDPFGRVYRESLALEG